MYGEVAGPVIALWDVVTSRFSIAWALRSARCGIFCLTPHSNLSVLKPDIAVRMTHLRKHSSESLGRACV